MVLGISISDAVVVVVVVVFKAVVVLSLTIPSCSKSGPIFITL